MPFQLILTLEYRTDTDWRWVLKDAAGVYLADQEVRLDRDDPLYEGFEDLPSHLGRYENVRPAEEVLAELGRWMGEKVFGALGEKLLVCERRPACVVEVRVPPAAQNLLFRPFELAHVGGEPLAAQGFRFIYTVARGTGHASHCGSAPNDGDVAEALRVLGVFSLPRDATPLNLRRERYQLQKLVRDFMQKGGRAVELRLLQYGATRELLEEVLQEAPGWDVMHFSGHGVEGELILEKPDGAADRIDAEELAELLRPAGARLKLLTLSACYSGAADVRAARAQVGLDNPPSRETAPAEATSVLPSLGQRLAEELDCAVLAMRYPVLDDFATELALTLYDRLLEKRQPLPQALQLALADALNPARDLSRPQFSRLTPLLFGARAADLRLQAPPLTPSFEPPEIAFDFPRARERFVGRLLPMLKASQALAPESGKTGVIFYGMAGAGKTACALELAYHYAPQNLKRFQGFVWHEAPKEGHDIADALTRLALSMEEQLPGLELVGLIDDPKDFQHKALPRLRRLLQARAILLVLDNLEGLLTSQGAWRDARWGELLKVLLDHDGLSRLVLTSRRPPAALDGHARLQADAIHALSFPESVLLARELPNLNKLFKDKAGRDKLLRILRAAQGHPKLLELANGLASDPAALEAQLVRDEAANGGADATTIAFFESGKSDREEDLFVRELRTWTEGVAHNLTPTARLLAQFLARLEDTDRTSAAVQANWEDFLKRLVGERGEEQLLTPEPALSQARAALAEPELGLESALGQLAQAGLIEIETTTTQEQRLTPDSFQTLLPILAAHNPEVANLLNNPQGFDQQDLMPHIQGALANPTDPALQAWLADQTVSVTRRKFRLHPGVAEALLRSAPTVVPSASDKEMGDYFISMHRHGIKTEMQGGGQLVVESARHAAPYLLRAHRWKEAAILLERLIQRDTSPETLGLVVPLLRQITEKTQGTNVELGVAGVLVNALLLAGRYAEAEKMGRDVIASCVAQNNYQTALATSGSLLNLLLDTGRFEEALKTAEDMAGYVRDAGLGSWTQLSTEGYRLQALNALGRYAEVLNLVEEHRARMKELPEEGLAEEIVPVWNVRETLLDIGRAAALRLEQWETVLALNAERVEYKRQRAASELEVARARFNDHSAFRRLRRYQEARALLNYCRAVFEQENAVYELSRAYCALAVLEAEEGDLRSASLFEQAALRYVYLTGRPEDCAVSHNNLANYIRSAEGSASEAMLAHRVANAIIYFQTNSGSFSISLHNLSRSPLPAAPPSFDQVCAIVEQIDGVRFRELFERLPKRAPDGDAAIQIVWEMATAEAQRLKGEVGRLVQEVLGKFEPLLQRIAAVARGEEAGREEIEKIMPKLEEDGWHISHAVQRIWAGERNAEALTEGLDEQDSALVRRVLELSEELSA